MGRIEPGVVKQNAAHAKMQDRQGNKRPGKPENHDRGNKLRSSHDPFRIKLSRAPRHIGSFETASRTPKAQGAAGFSLYLLIGFLLFPMAFSDDLPILIVSAKPSDDRNRFDFVKNQISCINGFSIVAYGYRNMRHLDLIDHGL